MKVSFGKMRTPINIVTTAISTDAEGFSTKVNVVLAHAQAYREGRHGSERWANMATFTEATDLFRFRVIPGVKVTTSQEILCDDGRFNIISVEDVKDRGMYIEALAKKVEASDG